MCLCLCWKLLKYNYIYTCVLLQLHLHFWCLKTIYVTVTFRTVFDGVLGKKGAQRETIQDTIEEKRSGGTCTRYTARLLGRDGEGAQKKACPGKTATRARHLWHNCCNGHRMDEKLNSSKTGWYDEQTETV